MDDYVNVRTENEWLIRETLGIKRKLTMYEKQFCNHEDLMNDYSYRDKFAKLMRKWKCAKYIPYRDYFTDFFMYYHRHIENKNQLQKAICRHRDILQGIIRLDDVQFYQRQTNYMLLTNPHALHIYSCSVPEYVTYCLDEIAKMRGIVAIIYEINVNMMCISQVDRVFADEVVVATIIAFL